MKMVNDYMESETISTITGSVKLSSLGTTLVHEHIFSNFNDYYVSALYKNPFSNYHAKLTFKNLSQFNQYPYSNTCNLTLNDEDTFQKIKNELKIFKEHNGGTIVENSNNGLHYNYLWLKQISEDTKVNIIFGTGYSAAKMQHSSDLNMTKEKIYLRMIDDLNGQFLESNKTQCTIKAGFIGEVGSTWPIEGYVGFSMFGTERSFHHLNIQADILSDAQRIALISVLKEEKKLDRVLISHDIHTKNRLKCYGGHGYSHIFENVVPYMRANNFTQDDINMLLIENPKNWLCWRQNTRAKRSKLKK